MKPNPEDLPQAKPIKPGIVVVLIAVVAGLIVLRADLWHWNKVDPMLFGFLPVGLWWQAMISILAAGMMWLMVRLAWPTHLEEAERLSSSNPHDTKSDQEKHA